MHGNCRKQKIENNKKIKCSQKLLEVKESTSVEGPTNCNVKTLHTIFEKKLLSIFSF